MSNPYGDYGFAGLGFTSLHLTEDGSDLSSAQVSAASSGTTYTDATGVVTFSADQSPVGVTNLNFTGNIILDLSGNVIAIAGTWTGRSHLNVSAKPAAAAASAHAEPAVHGIGPVSILQAHGSWVAFNRTAS